MARENRSDESREFFATREDESEEMIVYNVQVQRFGRVMKAALAAAVGALVVVGVKHIQPSGSLRADSSAVTNQAEMVARSEVVGRILSGWGEGLYHGEACQGTAEKTFTDDVVVDASGMDMKNTDIYKKYSGIYGLCQWFANQEQISFKDFMIKTELPSGYGKHGEDRKDDGLPSGWGGPGRSNDVIVVKVSNIPTVIATGKEADSPMQDMSRWTVSKDGMISEMDFHLGDSERMDELFAKYDAKAIVEEVMGDWRMGLYHGAACKVTAEKGPWTEDLVVDASGMDMYNTDIYKTYHGIDGLCEWFANQEQITFKGWKIETMLPSGYNDLILHVSHTPTVKATGKEADRPMHDDLHWTIRGGKISAMKFYLGDADAMDALFVKHDSKPIVQIHFLPPQGSSLPNAGYDKKHSVPANAGHVQIQFLQPQAEVDNHLIDKDYQR